MSLRPPSTSPSPSPGPQENGGRSSARQSMGPSARGTPGLAPPSPRPQGMSGARPTSELLGGAGMFQTPEAEALDQWFENLQNYEATLEEMAAASMDVNFKEELSAIEQWFKVLSEAERTAALYSLLQHSTQVQIRFFITVLQQMARSDPMTALLSPAMGGSMQSQMEAKLASMNLKSPGLKSPLPASPTARNFNTNRQSLVLDATPTNSSNFLSPESAAIPPGGSDAAATLAQQRAKLKASNAAHRISAPVLAGSGPNAWGPAPPQLGQVVEQQNVPAQEVVMNRPKSTEFSGTLGSPRPGAVGDSSPAPGDSWASMVNTPLTTLFPKAPQALDAAAAKINDWSGGLGGGPGVPRMGDPTVHRRTTKPATPTNDNNNGNAVYDDNGNLVSSNGNGNGQQKVQQGRGTGTGLRNGGLGGMNGPAGWGGARSPALSNVSSNRFGGSDDGGAAVNAALPNPALAGLGMMGTGVNGFGMNGMNMSPGLGMMGSPNGMMGVPPMSPFNMNMFSAMGISPEAQLLAAQMAASGFGQPGWMGMSPQGSAGMNSAGINNRGRGPGSARTPGSAMKSASSARSGMDSAGLKGDEEVDPALLNDIPGWLRSLRLHKYTPNFEGMRWQDMVVLDEAALEGKGVAALGARRKMLKTFENVRKKMGIEGGPPIAA